MSGEKELKGLGGWLILVGIGVVLSPIRLVIELVPFYFSIFNDGGWTALTTPSSDLYTPYFGALLIGEMSINFLMMFTWAYIGYLFFTKNYLFPKLYISIMAASLIFITFDAWVASQIFPGQVMFDADTKKEFMRTLVPALIWVPYMMESNRVKATFVEGRLGEETLAADDNDDASTIAA